MSHQEKDEVLAFLGLKGIPELGDRRIKGLVDRLGSGVRALRVMAQQLNLLESGSPEPALMKWRAEGIGVLPVTSERYPEALHELSDPPPLLFYRGRTELLAGPSVAIVGSRKATEAGRRTTEILAKTLVASGVTVISGMALGIDGAAHRGALEVGGATAAVMGSGLDVVYPGAHRPLFREIVSRGLVLSEFLPGERARPHHFPKRNRIIAALSQAIIVVEAGSRSGALITVDHGLDLGREVLAVPGAIRSPQAAGSNRLLREGARVITDPEAIVEDLLALGIQVRRSMVGSGHSESEPSGIPPQLAELWASLTPDPVGLEELAGRADTSFPEALAGLSALELGGWVERCPGMRFRRR